MFASSIVLSSEYPRVCIYSKPAHPSKGFVERPPIVSPQYDTQGRLPGRPVECELARPNNPAGSESAAASPWRRCVSCFGLGFNNAFFSASKLLRLAPKAARKLRACSPNCLHPGLGALVGNKNMPTQMWIRNPFDAAINIVSMNLQMYTDNNPKKVQKLGSIEVRPSTPLVLAPKTMSLTPKVCLSLWLVLYFCFVAE